ncbi:MAG: hypothetical protein ACREJC_22995 [Tepidisphaeraceae bacterium]
MSGPNDYWCPLCHVWCGEFEACTKCGLFLSESCPKAIAKARAQGRVEGILEAAEMVGNEPPSNVVMNIVRAIRALAAPSEPGKETT